VARARELTGNLSQQVELLLAAFLAEEHRKRTEGDRVLGAAVAAWNEFGTDMESFSDEHSTL